MVKKNIKAISPVVATALLLVVAVIAVVGFQTWFNTYQSGLNAKVEQQSNTGANVLVERLETNNVYLKNSGVDKVNVTEIKVSKDTSVIYDCKQNATNKNSFILDGNKVTEFNLNTTNCGTIGSLTQGDTADVVVITDKGVFSATEIVK